MPGSATVWPDTESGSSPALVYPLSFMDITVCMGQLSAILFDGDGTLIEDVPDDGNPSLVRPLGTAGAAVRRAKARRLLTGAADLALRNGSRR
jgi:hypothetical protein